MNASIVAPLALGLLVLLASSPVPGADETEEGGSADAGTIERGELEKAVAEGVKILLECQESSRAGGDKREWPYEGVYRLRGAIPIGYRVGGTAICAWALIEAPGWEADAARRKAVDRALGFILENLDHPLMAPLFAGSYDVRGWGHAYALTFLLRLRKLGRVPSAQAKAVDEGIELLVDALEKTQIPRSGGWNYSRPGGFLRPSSPSTFMTASTLQVFFAARAQGVAVRQDVVDRALRSMEAARLGSGAFQYSSSPRRQTGRGFEAVPGAVGRMPICEVTLELAGRGDTGRIHKAVDAFFEHWEWLEKRRQKTGTHVPPYMIAPYYFFYAHYYAAQAIELLPEKVRPAYRQKLYRLLWKVREPDHSWNDRVFPRSRNFGTAMSILAILEPHVSRPARWQRKN